MARHSELEQSKTKAQGALVSVLTLTQITELKLLLDIGRRGHRFYDFVLTLLIACISLEIFVGIIIIYIGNLHYSQSRRRRGFCRAFLTWCLCCCCRWTQTKRNGNYLSVRATTASGDASRVGGLGAHITDDDEVATGCCEMARQYVSYDSFIDLERADSNIEIAKVKVADAEVKTVRTMNYIRVVEDTLKKSPGNRDLEDELNKAKTELQCSMREKEEATAEQKLAEAHQHQAFFVKEQSEDREERVVYRKGTFWQHMATYLLYFIGLMNVFITTFGISGGHGNPVMGYNLTNYHT